MLDLPLRLEIAGEAGDSLELIGVAAHSCPDLVLLDWGLRQDAAHTLLAVFQHIAPEAQLLVLSSRPEARQEAEKAG